MVKMFVSFCVVVKHESVVHETSASDESVYAVSVSSVIVQRSA